MKKILLISFLLISFFGHSQKVDSTEICIPYEIGKKILIDLNECDKNKDLLKISEKEVLLLNKKIVEKDSIIIDQQKQIGISDAIIDKNKEKIGILDEENENLKKDIRKLKVKNTITNIVSGAIIGGLTYIIIFK